MLFNTGIRVLDKLTEWIVGVEFLTHVLKVS